MDGMHACDVVLSQKSSGDEVLYTRFFLLVELGRAELCQIRCVTAPAFCESNYNANHLPFFHGTDLLTEMQQKRVHGIRVSGHVQDLLNEMGQKRVHRIRVYGHVQDLLNEMCLKRVQRNTR